MTEPTPTASRRFALAFSAFWRTLRDPAFAAVVTRLQGGAGVAEVSPPPRKALLESAPNAALQLLRLLQQEGRLIDFLEEDVAAYTDADNSDVRIHVPMTRDELEALPEYTAVE